MPYGSRTRGNSTLPSRLVTSVSFAKANFTAYSMLFSRQIINPTKDSVVPEHYEPLQLSMSNHIDHGALYPNNFCSYGVVAESGGSDFFAVAPPTSDTAEVTFSSTRKHGAALSLPVVARREDTLSQAHFGTWMTRHIGSWFALSQRHGLGIEMEDIVLVTGNHRTRSWSNIAFYESRVDSRVSLRVQAPGIGTTVHLASFEPTYPRSGAKSWPKR
ncbi:hypothetical protein EDB84DRAFT_656724 [Lactarius hengduanensis]|nr:hypothetical protein EDB84DRAFT_656724 [Lactarius hengduanensis]